MRLSVKNTLFCSLLFSFHCFFAQTNTTEDCNVPDTFLVGEYEIQDDQALIGPINGTSNIEPGIYTVTANGNLRTFQAKLLPLFIGNIFTIELDLDCGLIKMNELDTQLACDPTNTILFSTTNDADSGTYDLIDDYYITVNYIEDSSNSCGPSSLASFTMSKACLAPEDVLFTNTTSSTIDINWTDPNDTMNSSISYSIEYGPSGFTQGSGQVISNISGDGLTVDNLQTDTMYDFYVWTACSAIATSDILGPFQYGTFENPVFELDTNGVTCLCENANIGDSGTVMVNGQPKTFTKRNLAQLAALIDNDFNDPEIALTCTSAIQDMSYLFEDKTTFNQDISSWDVSNVTNMQGMFYNVFDFNQDIGNWDVSNVVDMTYVFYVDILGSPPYSSFNGDIGNWDVSNVTNMSHMFENARNFNKSIGNWQVSNVNNMSHMFSSAINFNQNLNSWDVSNVSNMSYMFHMQYYNGTQSWENSLFNSPLNNWDVSNVTNMSHMFDNSNSFNQPISNWDVSNVQDMSYMFYRSDSFNMQINSWDVSNVSNMRAMFSRSVFNQPLNDWDVSSVLSMFDMFSASYYNHPLNDWDMSNVERTDSMFRNATSFNQPLNNWDVSSVTSANGMFRNATSFNQPLDNWDVSSLGVCWGMFHTATSFNQNINSWDVSNVGACFSMFFGASSFNQPLDNWDMSNASWLDGMFKNATSFNQPINTWDLSNANKMNRMFEGATSFNQSLDSWDVSGVTEMDMFFKDATSFNQDISGWCVESIPSEPQLFSDNSPLQNDFKPDWGATCTLNLEEFDIFSSLNIYPNPVEKQLNFSFNQTNSPMEQELILYDIQGKEILRNTYKQLPDHIDLSSLQKGVYLLKLSSGQQTCARRIIKE